MECKIDNVKLLQTIILSSEIRNQTHNYLE